MGRSIFSGLLLWICTALLLLPLCSACSACAQCNFCDEYITSQSQLLSTSASASASKRSIPFLSSNLQTAYASLSLFHLALPPLPRTISTPSDPTLSLQHRNPLVNRVATYPYLTPHTSHPMHCRQPSSNLDSNLQPHSLFYTFNQHTPWNNRKNSWTTTSDLKV